MNKKYLKYNKGFTLVELMVSMSIFMIVVLMALGALLIISGNAKKSRALHQSIDNVNFAMENMTREFRTGTNYDCISTGSIVLPASVTADCTDGIAVAFTPQEHSSSDAMYFFDDLEHSLKKCTSSGSSTSCINITSSDVSVDNVKFFVKGTDLPSVGEYTQPSIYMIVKGHVTSGTDQQDFSLQTMASQRSAE